MIVITKELLYHIAFDIFIVWLTFEIIFFAIISIAVHFSLQKLKTPPAYDMHPVKLVKKIIHDIERLSTYSEEEFFAGFFCGAKVHEIKMGNLKSFMAWVMYASLPSNLTAEQSAIVDEACNILCTRYKLSIEPGYNYDVKHVKMTLEPLLFIHRPLIVYVITGLKNMVTEYALMFSGFQKSEVRGIKYWYRPANNNQGKTLPMLFFHGITTGWGIYMQMIKILAGESRDLFLFELDGVKVNSLNFHMPTAEEYAAVVKYVLDKHQIAKVSVVGHSFGSITAGWFIKAHPEYLAHITLVDPVSLLLGLPDVAFNFLYRKPSTLVHWLIHLGASRELTVANALRRNFWWYKNILWLDDLPHDIGILVSIGGNDEVAKASSVAEYIHLIKTKRELNCPTGAPVASILLAGQSHAEVLFRTQCLQDMASVLHQQEKYHTLKLF